MLGWHFTIERQLEPPGAAPLAVWQTGIDGLDWVRQLAKAGEVISPGGDGYPYTFTAITKYLEPIVLNGPPLAKAVWSYDHGDILLPGWQGKTCINHEAWKTCEPDEWLTITVFDES